MRLRRKLRNHKDDDDDDHDDHDDHEEGDFDGLMKLDNIERN